MHRLPFAPRGWRTVLLAAAAALAIINTPSLQARQFRPVVPKKLSTPELAKKASPSMVTITTPGGLGSGVILSPNGIIVTNLHVIRGESKVQVRLSNGDVYDDVEIIDVDERKDILLLRVKAFGLTPAPVGDSDKVAVGDHVVLIGSPRGLDQSISDGLISAFRDGDGYRLFQTSAAASPGSSGGGMFSETGDLIGVVCSKLTNGENINFGVPANYVRGLMSSQGRMTLAEFNVRYPGDSPSREPRNVSDTAAPASVTPAAIAKLASLLSTSKLQWTKTGDAAWSTAYRGKNVPSITVYVSVIGDLVVTQSLIAESLALRPDQLTALLQFNYGVDLVKLSISEDRNKNKNLLALNETELRVLDAAALERIVDAVALGADDVATIVKTAGSAPPAPAPSAPPPGATTPIPMSTLPALTAPARADGMSTLSMLNNHAGLRYDPALWKPQQASDPGTFQFAYAGGDLYMKVITERIEVPIDRLGDIVFQNMLTSAPDAKITRRGSRMVNGVRVIFQEVDATVNGISVTFFNHMYSDTSGTIQILTCSGRGLMPGFLSMVDKTISGFVVNR